jgi:hypothetical protein
MIEYTDSLPLSSEGPPSWLATKATSVIHEMLAILAAYVQLNAKESSFLDCPSVLRRD